MAENDERSALMGFSRFGLFSVSVCVSAGLCESLSPRVLVCCLCLLQLARVIDWVLSSRICEWEERTRRADVPHIHDCMLASCQVTTGHFLKGNGALCSVQDDLSIAFFHIFSHVRKKNIDLNFDSFVKRIIKKKLLDTHELRKLIPLSAVRAVELFLEIELLH